MKKSESLKVTIMGLGLHGGGLAAARFFARCKALVLVTDTKTRADLSPSLKKLARYKNISYALGKHRKSDFARADLIIRNPAVPNDSQYLKIARDRGIPVHTDVSWFLQLLKRNSEHNNEKKTIIIGITGTKGKSTTSALLHYALTKAGKKAILAGNIRKSPLDYLTITTANCKLPTTNYVILELSSWHLESLHEHRLAPHIALITNILPDHLNRYAAFEAYAKTKLLIHEHQTKRDVLFINKNDSVSQARAAKEKGREIIKFSEQTMKYTRALLHPVAIGAVSAITKYLRVKTTTVQKAIKTFPGLKGRLQYAGNVNGVRYYNDTCATQPDAVQFAVDRIKKQELKSKNLILIAGGQDKNLNYEKLADTIARSVQALILFKGSASNKIAKTLLLHQSKTLHVHQNITSMKEAVALAKKYAHPGDVVLLSPGAASFGLFKHEFDRGKQFVHETKII